MFRKGAIILPTILSVVMANNAMAASSYTVKKASSIGASGTTAGNKNMLGDNLLQSAIALGMGAVSINRNIKSMSAECAPSASDVAFVTKMVQELAKTNSVDANTFIAAMGKGMMICGNATSNYSVNANYIYRGASGVSPCTPIFDSAADASMVWNGFPKPETAKVKKNDYDAESTAITVSNVYDIFAVISNSYFGPEDYLSSEFNQANKLIEKTEKCSVVQLNKKKQEAWMGFATQVIGAAGSGGAGGNLGDTMQSVMSITQQGSGLSPLLNVGTGLMMQKMSN